MKAINMGLDSCLFVFLSLYSIWSMEWWDQVFL